MLKSSNGEFEKKALSLIPNRNVADSLTSISLIRFPFNSVPSSFLMAFFRSLLFANSKVLESQTSPSLESVKKQTRLIFILARFHGLCSTMYLTN